VVGLRVLARNVVTGEVAFGGLRRIHRFHSPLLGAGIVGLFMRLYDFPIAPVILGAILGPNLESQLRRALTASNGDWSIFVTRPSSAIFQALAVVAVVLPYPPWLIRRMRGEHVERAKVAVGDED
jgi:putative tricarboxylic transport membrane protein